MKRVVKSNPWKQKVRESVRYKQVRNVLPNGEERFSVVLESVGKKFNFWKKG